MSRCKLGEKKLRRLREATGRPDIAVAYVRGGWEHSLALVRFTDGSHADVNRYTGEVYPGDPIAELNARIQKGRD